MSKSLSCKKCGHVLRPRKTSTRYPCQYRVCNSCELDSSNNPSKAVNQTKTVTVEAGTGNSLLAQGTKVPAVIFNLMGISGATSPENALQRSFELYRKLAPYKWKYNLQSSGEVVEFLEKKSASDDQRVSKAEKRVKELLDRPE